MIETSETIERDGEQSRFMVLLHGYGESPADLTERIDLIDPLGRFVLVVPEAPFRRRGLAIWHRAATAGLEAEQQYLASLAALDRLVGETEQRLQLPASEAVVGGFSQGGGLAIGLLLGADVDHRIAAGFGICSFPPMVRGFRVDRRAAAGRPYFLSSARADHFAPIEMSRQSAALLADCGLDVSYSETAGSHEMTDEAAAKVGEWLAAGVSGEQLPRSDLLDGVTGREIYAGLWDLVT